MKMKIEVLGMGCSKCTELENNVKKAVEELQLNDVEIKHIKDMAEILSYGVMSTPALVVDDVIKANGRVPGVEELKKMLKK